ncbi:hypothetical protein ACJY9E_001280 [Escherichia coli]|uniref:hypothetical protein n=2 Tax=Escherichia coli TaxID=562 RepID=UPI00200B6287|nr:hypothetical protein [Escherichia coli]MCN4832512.1 hypothetical protein [Escherichia coli]MCN5264372.1 hypothetical protein [Escherichia coli]MCN8983410.1 hypothetical protein [Escherichia coli]
MTDHSYMLSSRQYIINVTLYSNIKKPPLINIGQLIPLAIFLLMENRFVINGKTSMKKQDLVISKDGETMTVSDENIIKVAALLGVTPESLRSTTEQFFKSADAQKPTMQDLIKAKAEQIKQSKKGNN